MVGERAPPRPTCLPPAATPFHHLCTSRGPSGALILADDRANPINLAQYWLNMDDNIENYPTKRDSDRFGTHITDGGDNGRVSKEDRKLQVLEFLAETRIAMPRTVLFRNLSYRGAKFSDSSLKNYLRELREDGLVERIDAEEFKNGRVRVSDSDPGYWIVTKEGYAKADTTNGDDIDTSHL